MNDFFLQFSSSSSSFFHVVSVSEHVKFLLDLRVNNIFFVNTIELFVKKKERRKTFFVAIE